MLSFPPRLPRQALTPPGGTPPVPPGVAGAIACECHLPAELVALWIHTMAVADDQQLSSVSLTNQKAQQVAEVNYSRVGIAIIPPGTTQIWEGGTRQVTISGGPQPGTPIPIGGGWIYGPEYVGEVWVVGQGSTAAPIDVRVKELSSMDLGLFVKSLFPGGVPR